MSSISSFDIISVVVLSVIVSAADTVAINPNGMKTLLANCWSTFFINGKRFFSNQPRSLPKYPPDCSILNICVFNSLISADK